MSSMRRSFGALVLMCGLFPWVAGGCSLKGAVDEAGAVDVDAELDVRTILRGLFPKLTDSEIDELTTKLDLETVLALQAELEKARKEAVELSDELFTTSEERVEERTKDLEAQNEGYPVSLEAIGGGAFYSKSNGEVRVELSGLFSGKTSYSLGAGDVSVALDGATQENAEVSCLAGGDSVDLVFLVDVTGSMSNVIDSVRSSLLSFVDALKSSDLDGTISVVSFQDTVGEQVSFQELEKNGFERSPFIAKRKISSAADMNEVERFIAKLEANRGADLPENLAGAVDFARNSVIGLRNGAANVIGDGADDPAGTVAFPALGSKRQVFVAITDATFHSDSRNARNSSLEPEFQPRPLAQIVDSLRRTGTVVHVVDPSWVDETVDPTGGASESEVDADYFAIATGGVGQDKVAGYSITDLELVAVAEKTGLLDIALHDILKGSCRVTFPALDVAAGAELSVTVSAGGEVFDGKFAVVTE